MKAGFLVVAIGKLRGSFRPENIARWTNCHRGTLNSIMPAAKLLAYTLLLLLGYILATPVLGQESERSDFAKALESRKLEYESIVEQIVASKSVSLSFLESQVNSPDIYTAVLADILIARMNRADDIKRYQRTMEMTKDLSGSSVFAECVVAPSETKAEVPTAELAFCRKRLLGIGLDPLDRGSFSFTAEAALFRNPESDPNRYSAIMILGETDHPRSTEVLLQCLDYFKLGWDDRADHPAALAISRRGLKAAEALGSYIAEKKDPWKQIILGNAFALIGDKRAGEVLAGVLMDKGKDRYDHMSQVRCAARILRDHPYLEARDALKTVANIEDSGAAKLVDEALQSIDGLSRGITGTWYLKWNFNKLWVEVKKVELAPLLERIGEYSGVDVEVVGGAGGVVSGIFWNEMLEDTFERVVDKAEWNTYDVTFDYLDIDGKQKLRKVTVSRKTPGKSAAPAPPEGGWTEESIKAWLKRKYRSEWTVKMSPVHGYFESMKGTVPYHYYIFQKEAKRRAERLLDEILGFLGVDASQLRLEGSSSGPEDIVRFIQLYQGLAVHWAGVEVKLKHDQEDSGLRYTVEVVNGTYPHIAIAPEPRIGMDQAVAIAREKYLSLVEEPRKYSPTLNIPAKLLIYPILKKAGTQGERLGYAYHLAWWIVYSYRDIHIPQWWIFIDANNGEVVDIIDRAQR